jgi:two-component system phosphate regulon sensor histidine kinase PhoR
MINDVKIIVVDDDQPTRDLVVDILKYSVNRDVLPFENGLVAWRYIESGNDVDIVIHNVDIPEMGGFELLAKIKDKYPGIICVMMSGSPSSEKSAEKLGADAFLSKPFNMNDLFDIVQVFVVGSEEVNA